MQCAPPLSGTTAARCAARLVNQHRFAGLHLAHEFGADEIERAGLGRDDPVVMNTPQYEGAEAERIAEGDERPFRQRNDGIRALEALHRVRNRLVERRAVVRDQRGDHFAVRG